ncbi:MAG: amidohydrolase [Gemmobacter sp.]|jgi:hippurate hydrolase|nr:amidohydrolase [Gemmobacter sp.]
MPVKNRLTELHPEITGWRRELHQHPELLYDTGRTSAFVAERLRAFGCDEVVEGIGRTGVVGLIRGRSDSKGYVVGLRADMDALPIIEETGLDYASLTPGKMHACGHDGHTAMLLGAARYLAETRNFDGAVAVIFQPAEEGGAGGKAMVDDGMLERFSIREVYGMHNEPGLPVGAFAIRPGNFFAAMDTFEIELVGKGGHAAMPQNTVDTVLMASNAVVALQSIVSRNANPVKELVVSVTSFRSESEAFNVIPERVTLRGTLRCFDPVLRAQAEQRVHSVVGHIAQAYGGRAEIDYRVGYPAMVNDEVETTYAIEAASRVSGSVGKADLTMGGEDFAFMLQACKGAYIQIGNGPSAKLHHPAYDFNDEIIPFGVSYWAELVEMRMPVG